MSRPPKQPPAKKLPNTIALGSTGLRQFGGFLSEEFLPELSGQRGVKKFKEMADNDPVVGAVLLAITALIRQTEWIVQPADDSPESDDAKTFVEEVLADMRQPFSSVIAEACSMFTYGYAPLEVIWKIRDGQREGSAAKSKHDDGRIGVADLSIRAQTTVVRWEFDPDTGDLLGLHQQPWSGTPVMIPIERLLLFRTTSERGNPEGRSILRNAYRPHYFKKRLEEIEAVGVERDLAGLPVARIPSQYFDASATAEDRKIMSDWQNLVRKIRRDQHEGLVLPSDTDTNGQPLFDLKLLATAGSRTFDTTKILERYDRAIATSVLADFIFLGQQAVGSFALSSDKTALFATVIGAFMKSMADEFNEKLLPDLWALNGFDPEFMPRLQPSDLEHQALSEISAFLTSLAGAGAQLFPDRMLENHLRKIAGLPPAPEETDDMLEEDEITAPEPPEPEPTTPEPPEPEAPEPVTKAAPRSIKKDLIYDDTGRLVSVIEHLGGDQ